MVGTAPERYVTKVRKPADFDQYWEGVLHQAAEIPLDLDVRHEPLRSTEDIDVYEVFYTSLDSVRIAGWYAKPKESRGLLPAILTGPGYVGEPSIPKEWARRGYAALSVAPRGKLRSNHQFNPGYPGLLTHGIVDRNTYSYRGFYVDMWRGVDFLLDRQEVDSSRIGVVGSSQGGGLAITTSAMRPEIKAASAGIPYLSGIIDAIELTHTYPYQEINDYLRLHPERRQDVEETLAYFDCINFAGKIRCPIIVNIGIQDNVCPAETGYSVFNAIGSTNKHLYAYEGQGHDGGPPEHSGIVSRFFEDHLKAKEQ
jgi:cephalosporin-C deacetylase